MQIVSSASPFTFIYPAFDQSTSLNVQATIYDVTTGTAVLVTTVAMSNDTFGVYSGNYTGANNHIYLVIVLVYTDNTFATVDTTRAPWADVYNLQSTATFFGFNYGAYDQASNLYIAASVYDTTTGSTFLSQVQMTHVLGGVYFGSYTSTVFHAYIAAIASYTSNTYVTLDTTRAPASQAFQALQSNAIYNSYVAAFMTGQALTATLVQT